MIRATASAKRMKQVVDWRAAVWAGLVAGALFLVILLVAYPLLAGGTAWTILRFIGAILLGDKVLPPPNSFHLAAVITGLIVHFALSVGFAAVLAFVVHRFGILIGIVGGAAFGLALYLINFYSLSAFFPWFFSIRSWPFLVGHLLFGAVVGGLYEALEVERYVPAGDEES